MIGYFVLNPLFRVLSLTSYFFVMYSWFLSLSWAKRNRLCVESHARQYQRHEWYSLSHLSSSPVHSFERHIYFIALPHSHDQKFQWVSLQLHLSSHMSHARLYVSLLLGKSCYESVNQLQKTSMKMGFDHMCLRPQWWQGLPKKLETLEVTQGSSTISKCCTAPLSNDSS